MRNIAYLRQLIEYSTENDRMTERVQRGGSAPLVCPGDRWANWERELPAAVQHYSEGLPHGSLAWESQNTSTVSTECVSLSHHKVEKTFKLGIVYIKSK